MDARAKLRELSGMEYAQLVTRCNSAIFMLVSSFGKRVVGPLDGGWMTYAQYTKAVGKRYLRVATDWGKLRVDLFNHYLKPGDLFMYHALGAYAVEQDVKAIYDWCHENGVLVAMDVSGCLGTPLADGKYCDIMFGSFGKWKPVNLGDGGFIASTTHQQWIKSVSSSCPFKGDETLLCTRLDNLPLAYKELGVMRETLCAALPFEHVTSQYAGTILVKASENEVKPFLDNYEYTLCPREIRVNKPCVSIELKRNLTK